MCHRLAATAAEATKIKVARLNEMRSPQHCGVRYVNTDAFLWPLATPGVRGGDTEREGERGGVRE